MSRRAEKLDPLRLQPRSLTTPREEPLDAHLRQWTQTPDGYERSLPGGGVVELAVRGSEAVGLRVDRGPWRVLSPRVPAAAALATVNGVAAVVAVGGVWPVVEALGVSVKASGDGAQERSRER